MNTQSLEVVINMYMDLKRIIREEMDEFGWMRGVNPEFKKIIFLFEPPINTHTHWDTIKKSLRNFNPNMKWCGGNSLDNFHPQKIVGYFRVDEFGNLLQFSLDESSIEELEEKIMYYEKTGYIIVDGQYLLN